MHKPHAGAPPYRKLTLSKRARCPICKEEVYSLSGVHPQCAMSVTLNRLPPMELEQVVAVVE